MNRDNILNETESFYQYHIELFPSKLNVGENFITSIQTATMDGDTVNWYHFKIPINSFEIKNGTVDFTSIRFMRICLTGFKEPAVLRFARLELSKK